MNRRVFLSRFTALLVSRRERFDRESRPFRYSKVNRGRGTLDGHSRRRDHLRMEFRGEQLILPFPPRIFSRSSTVLVAVTRWHSKLQKALGRQWKTSGKQSRPGERPRRRLFFLHSKRTSRARLFPNSSCLGRARRGIWDKGSMTGSWSMRKLTVESPYHRRKDLSSNKTQPIQTKTTSHIKISHP